MKTVLILAIIIALIYAACPNSCGGHGTCNMETNICDCDDSYTGADCSLRTCPKGPSYTNIGSNDVVDNGGNNEGTDTEAPRVLGEELETPTQEEFDFDNSTKVERDIKIPGFGILGGILSCSGVTIDVIYYDGDNVIVRNSLDYENVIWSSCRIITKRNDLSTMKPISFEGSKDTKPNWLDTSDLNHYGIKSDDKKEYDLVCRVDNSKVDFYKDRNNSAIFIKATLTITNEASTWTAKSDSKLVLKTSLCYPLIGYNGREIYIDNSDVFSTLMYKEKRNYYFGIKPSEGVQISIKTEFIDSDNGKYIQLPYEVIPPAILPYIIEGASLHFIFNPTSKCGDSCVAVYFVTKIKKITDSFRFEDGEPTQEEVDGPTKEDDSTRLLYESRELKQVDGIKLELDPPIPTEYLDKDRYSIDLNILKSESTLHKETECSDNGECDRTTGLCQCNDGFTGVACQILSNCPNNCNNYGRCVVIDKVLGEDKKLAGWHGNSKDSVLYGCKCDEGHRGADCSLLECPSSVDPQGATNKWEFDSDKGLQKPLSDDEQRDCSGRGICDYATGTCSCFSSFKGTACEEMSMSLM